MLLYLWKQFLKLLGCREGQAAKLLIRLTIPDPIGVTIHYNMAEVILLPNQVVIATIRPVTASGKPAKLDDVPQWETSDPAVVSIEVAEDGLSAILTTHDTGETEAAVVSVRADADLDDNEERVITGTVAIVVKEREAEAFIVVLGEPQDV